MGRVTPQQIEAVKEEMTLSVYMQDFPEARHGKREILVSCCFHEDKHPSLSINTEAGWFKCWACGTSGGDVIAYLQKRTGRGFVEVVESLTGGARIEPIARRSTTETKQDVIDERKAQAILRVWNEAEELSSESSD
ncbi:MAG: hypothetical protein IT343_01715 [Candidatus Melainabacteria bacterium]|nr:hypothetical protein [Candidatus Melainabacteria bacterium]